MGQSFGEKLRILRKSRKITQQKLSEILNVDRSNIAHYETGKRIPPIETFAKIAGYFNISIDILANTFNCVELRENNLESTVDVMRREIDHLNDINTQLNCKIIEQENEIKYLKDTVRQFELFSKFFESSGTKTN